MKLKFLGAAGTVTGSSYALTSNSGKSILIDMGMFQGTPDIEAQNYLPFEFDVAQLSDVILTHAHLDHCGRLPLLMKLGFRGNIWMTPATLDLTQLVLFDSAKIAKIDKEIALYDRTLVEQMLTTCRTQNYNQTFSIADFEVQFYDAGHLLGAASLEITDKSSDKNHKIIFSGDIGNYPSPLLDETKVPSSATTVVMESTYGNRLHTEHHAAEALQHEINIIEKTQGTLLIPAFSLEKTQELLYMIRNLKRNGSVNKQTPVFMDSPMARKATDIYLSYPHLLNQKVQAEIKRGEEVFEFPSLVKVLKHKDSLDIHNHRGAKVIIAGGGMMTGGRILTHAKFFLKNPSNRIFFVGYQGEETIGRDILEGKSPVVIDGTPVHIMAEVNKTKAMSAHADQNQLINWLKTIHDVNQVILTHGEDKSRQTLAERIKTDLKIADVYLPKQNEEMNI